MRRFVIAIILAFGCLSAHADWDLKDLNRTIEQTNFVVDDKCSGTLISIPEKLVLTNWHCVEARIDVVEREITSPEGYVRKVKLRRYADVPIEQRLYDKYTPVGSISYLTEIVSEEQGKDLALLRIRGPISQSYASPLGGTVARGEDVYIVGNPALLVATVGKGLVSSVNRTFEFSWTAGEKTPMIQHSAGSFGGNSGGALYNVKGELVGVPSAGFRDATFIGLAIPVVPTVQKFISDACLASVYDAKADDAKCREAKAKKAEKAEKSKAD